MTCLVRHWTTSRVAALAALLLAAGLPAGAPVWSSIDPEAACADPGLARYTTRDYATEKGARRRCELLQLIGRDGPLSSQPLREQVLNELANRFAVQLDFSGTVDLPRRAVDYLMKNMPEAAVLVSAYSGNEYMATQVDGTPGPKRFFVTNNDTFAAGFTYLSSRTLRGLSEYTFFETGRAKVLLWRIWGNSIVHYALRDEDGESSSYEIRVHVFTNSRVLSVVLESGLFRYFARKMFEGILSDIEDAVDAFGADTNSDDKLPPYFVSGLSRSLQAPEEEYREPPPFPRGAPWSMREAL